jgi:hypothetical protein
VNVYRPQGVVFFGIEQGQPVNLDQVLSYAGQFGWDFPIGIDGGTIFSQYDTMRHNYFVIGADGRITFRAEAGGYTGAGWSTYEPRLKQAIEAALTSPVQDVTWGRIKALYR